ncbi:MAG: hypothetical protein ND866_05430 [Pyrinomonadaceae bacterium]|nr:hypothetical protein [Pyrinomonadaceae bacterium]
MFVGHYGASFAAKALKNSIPLWILFVAVQLVDVLWSIFVLLGIEKVRIVPGITATNPLDLYYMPYTHSLVGSLLWAIAAVVVYCIFSRRANAWVAGGIVGAAVFSHWLLDLLVHRPDLPLYDSVFKMGLGLWNYPALAFALEVVFLFDGMYLYLTSTKPVSSTGRYGMLIFGFVMLGVQAFVFFGPPPTSANAAALTAFAAYAIFAGFAHWLERKRT